MDPRSGMRRAPALAAGLLLGPVVALTGCGAFQEPPEPTRLTAPPETFTEQPATSEPTPEFTIVDSMFAQMMIPHHEQALEMAALVPERSAAPEVTALAAEIDAAQGPEIEQMRRWLEEWGLETDIDLAEHEDHLGMEGMLSDAEMAALEAASGAEFDRLWLEGMIRHHEGAVTMAETQLASGIHEPSRELAEEIIRTQQAEITRMRAMLGE